MQAARSLFAYVQASRVVSSKLPKGARRVSATSIPIGTLGALARRVTATSIPLAVEANLYEDPSLVGHLVGVGNGQQVWVWSLGHVAQLWDRWGRPPHQQDASRDAISLRFPLVDFILDSVETQVSSLGAQAASPCDKVEAAAGGAPRSHASERAAAAASLPCEDNAAVRTKDKPFVLTPRTHMGIFEENGTSLVLHWRGCVAEGDKPPKAKKPNGKNGCSGKQIACKSALKCCKKHIEIPFGLIQTKLYFFPRKKYGGIKKKKYKLFKIIKIFKNIIIYI